MSDNAIKFSETEILDEVEYRSISPLAIVSLVLGLASLVALVSPKLWLLPAVSAAISIVALRSISKSAGVLTGAILPVISLLGCLAILAYIPARQFSRDVILYQQARTFAEEFLQLLRDGRSREAYLLTKDPSERKELFEKLQQPPPEAGRSSAPTAMMETFESPHRHEQGFLASSLVAAFQRATADHPPKVEFVRNEQTEFTPPSADNVVLRYRVESVNERGDREAKEFLIPLLRESPAGQVTADWRVGETNEAKAQ